MKYDTIVTGAGPAGLTAARIISNSGFEVAVFEKARYLGAKPCGEAISKQTLEDALMAPSSDIIAQEIRCASIYAPNRKNITIKEEIAAGYVVNKAMFLQCLAEKAVEAGAKIYMNQAVVDLEHKGTAVKVTTSKDEQQTNLLLGADGFTSIVPRKLGFEKSGEREIIPCVQYLMENCDLSDPQATEFYFGNEVAPLGYAWIFPKGNGKAKVGIGVRGRPAKPYLDKFIKQNSGIFAKARRIWVEAAPVTISGLSDKIVDDNVMLVGEAAGQVIPLTGGGIHSSIVGGRMAGETAVEALEEENLSYSKLVKYAEHYNEHWGKRIRDSLRALKVLEKLNDSDLNNLASLLEPRDILDLANGTDIKRVGRKFLKHPLFGLKMAKALLTA
ncbi:NAD(P)/FAD-dependent oxidoreductase [Candidatus Bathyarchaeota archaeon]|nr:NAD(P)/FAD-dependent oxidoreductase [Candidatus Bathyarchaeota archaeon]